MKDSVRTIVALVTPPGEGGLAVVRVSGSAALKIARTVFPAWTRATGPESHRAVHGSIVWPHAESGASDHPVPRGIAPGHELDTVVALPFLGPRSYTGEDTIEFFCHGGRLAARLVVEACLAAGAVPAGPGEFTRRAFLNGKLSLDQAEAVADLIQAEDALGARASVQQLRGGFDRELRAVEEPLLALQAELEGSLEFVAEERLAAVDAKKIRAVLGAARRRVESLLELAVAGRRLRDGVHVVLTGPPNVGKSSLFNALLGEARALVDPEPGTTRDVVTAYCDREGLRFHLHDTAGLRSHGGRLERLGMERTRAALDRADVTLCLERAVPPVDGSRSAAAAPADVPIADASMAAEPIPAEAIASGPTRLAVWTKADLLAAAAKSELAQSGSGIVTSAVTGEGLEELWGAVLQIAAGERLGEAVALGVVLNQRHRERLVRCRNELRELMAETASGATPDEVVASWLGSILGELGEITGRVYTEKLLGEIFGRFCIGK